jgi:hypothetical protein
MVTAYFGFPLGWLVGTTVAGMFGSQRVEYWGGIIGAVLLGGLVVIGVAAGLARLSVTIKARVERSG